MQDILSLSATELGKKIASTRAQKEAFRKTNDFYIDLKQIITWEFEDLDVLIKGSKDAIQNCKKHVYDLSGYTSNN